MTRSRSHDDEFTQKLQWEHLLDEFEKLCRSGDPKSITAFIQTQRDAAPSSLREFIKIAAQYQVDLAAIANELGIPLGQLATAVGRDPRIAETAVLMETPAVRRSAPRGHAIDHLGPPQAEGEIGRIGGFRVLKELGSGGMGTVFLGEDPRLGRQIAIKLMRPQITAVPGANERFLREARMLAAIENDHVVPVFQVDEENGVPFLTMPLLKGATLDQLLRIHGSFPTAVALRIGHQICLGLAAAHAKGLIHRDVKPANVWIEVHKTWRVKLLDFGLARIEQSDASLTSEGELLGTPAYMAPEQARGEEIDARADLFSVGAVLYEMLTGKRPFDGPNAISVLTKIATHHPAPPSVLEPKVAPEVSQYVLELLDKSPEGRPPSAAEAAKSLAKLITVKGKRPERAGASSPAPRSLAQSAPPPASPERAILAALPTSPPTPDAPHDVASPGDSRLLADPFASQGVNAYFRNVAFDWRPLALGAGAILLSIVVMPIFAITMWRSYFPGTNPKTSAASKIAAEKGTRETPAVVAAPEPVASSKKEATSPPPDTPAPGGDSESNADRSAARGAASTPSTPPANAPSSGAPAASRPKTKQAPEKELPPLRTIQRRFDPQKPIAVTDAGKYRLELVLIDKADPARFSTVFASGSASNGGGYTPPNLLLGLRVQAASGGEAFGISARYELTDLQGRRERSRFSASAANVYPMPQADLLPLCVYVPIEREKVQIQSPQGALLVQPQSRVEAAFSGADAQRGASKSSSGFRFQIEAIQVSSDIEVTVAVSEPQSIISNPQDFGRIMQERMNRRLEVRLRDSQGGWYAPSAMEPLGAPSGFAFQSEFRFGGAFGPGGSRSSSNSKGAGFQSAPNRFLCRFEALPADTRLSKVECAVVSPKGDLQVIPFEFQNIPVVD